MDDCFLQYLVWHVLLSGFSNPAKSVSIPSLWEFLLKIMGLPVMQNHTLDIHNPWHYFLFFHKLLPLWYWFLYVDSTWRNLIFIQGNDFYSRSRYEKLLYEQHRLNSRYEPYSFGEGKPGTFKATLVLIRSGLRSGLKCASEKWLQKKCRFLFPFTTQRK